MTSNIQRWGLRARVLVVAAGLMFVSGGHTAASPDSWLPLSDRSLVAAIAGNALDFSALGFDGPAGQFGWARSTPAGQIVFQRQGASQRFFVATLVFSGPVGKIPDKDGVGKLVQELKRSGYNAVRLHYVDALLMDDRDDDFDIDPQQFDRLHFLLSRLKEAGIYWIVDGLTSDNGGYGNVRPHRFIRKHKAKLGVVVSGEGLEHWGRLVGRIWGTRNPYTGIAPLRDPAMLGVILVNEGSIAFISTLGGNRYSPELAPGFRRWLAGRYPSDDALHATWGRELAPGESLSTRVELPATIRGDSARSKDFARYVSDIERSAFARMDQRLRDMGYGGLTTAFNNWGVVLSGAVSRLGMGWIDMHSYHDLPTAGGKVGSTNLQTSLFATQARAALTLSNARHWGKPFTVSEYGQPFWNGYRYETSALVPAMAAHQGWSAICLFAEATIQLDYEPGPSAPSRRRAIYPFGTGSDPITHAGERLAALLFLRGDVRTSDHRIRLRVDPDKLFDRDAGWGRVPEELSRLALIAPIGLDFGPIPDRTPQGELWLDLTSGPPAWGLRSSSELPASAIDWRNNATAALRGAGIIGPQNTSRPEASVFESDTGELKIDGPERRIQVSTARSSVIVLKGGDASNPGFSVHGASGPGLFAVASLDGLALAESRHLLVWVLTDAMNTGMKFEDASRTKLVEIGKFPPLVRAIRATLRLNAAQGETLRVWPLSLAGERRREVALKTHAKGIELEIDTAALPDGPVLYFEIAAK